MHFCIRDQLNVVVHDLISNKNKHPMGYLISYVTLLFVALLTIEIINFEVINKEIVIPESWNENITAGCGEDVLDDAY
jgi:hypothetical protein